jgi:hypothetical protein
MRTINQAALLFACGAALLAQQQDVIFTAAAPVGMPGMAGPHTFAFVAGELLGGNPVKGAPYSGNAVTDSTQTLADGNRIVNHTTAVVYRDGEGRERREQSIPNIGPFAAQGAPPMTIFISDPVAGVNYSLNPSNKTAIKMPVPQIGSRPPMPPGAPGGVMVQRFDVAAGGSEVERDMKSPGVMIQRSDVAGGGATASIVAPPGPSQVMIYSKSGMALAANPPDVQQLGTKVVEGVQADGTRTTLTIPAGQIGNVNAIQIVDEVWRSPELQVIVHSEHSDPRMGTTVYSLQNISRSDPSPALFQVPADYTVTDSPVFQKTLLPPPQ